MPVDRQRRKGTVPKTEESSGKGREWIGSQGSKKTDTQVFVFSKYCLGGWGDDSAGKMLAVQPSRRTGGWTLRTHVNATQATHLQFQPQKAETRDPRDRPARRISCIGQLWV